MIRYVLTWPGMLNAQAAERVNAMLEEAVTSRRWRDIVLPAGATLERLNERPVPSIATRNAQRLGERVR
jgi:hypothetical protein